MQRGMDAVMDRPEFADEADDLTDKTVGQRVRHLRMQRNLTQRELAALSGLSAAAIYRIERDHRSPSIRTLRKLEAALDCDLLELFGLEPGG